MIILGIVLLILGFIFGVPILWTIGIILVVIGVPAVLMDNFLRQRSPRRQ